MKALDRLSVILYTDSAYQGACAYVRKLGGTSSGGPPLFCSRLPSRIGSRLGSAAAMIPHYPEYAVVTFRTSTTVSTGGIHGGEKDRGPAGPMEPPELAHPRHTPVCGHVARLLQPSNGPTADMF
jgi:hypothetical protein